MTVDALETLQALNAAAAELDQLAAQLDECEDKLRGVELEYEEFMGGYEQGLWELHVSAGAKFPPQALRERMGRKAMPPELLGRYAALTSRRRRLREQISTAKASMEARRSILSALKVGFVE